MTTDETRWALKIVALLHDPPSKALDIQNHAGQAEDLVRLALGRAATREEWDLAKMEADPIASAFDRANFPQDRRLVHDFPREPRLAHPLGGEQLLLPTIDVDVAAVRVTEKAVVSDLVAASGSGPDTLKRRYLTIWRCLLPELRRREAGLGALWDRLPAETRLPDHSIWSHQGATAAVVSALPHPALIVLSLGPVQEFIAAARRTLDLWTGSFLISYLAWAAIESIADRFGPDAILYPSLWGQPLADMWLRKQVGGSFVPEPPAGHRLRATLPNKLVALVPAGEVGVIADAATAQVNARWLAMANDVNRSVKGWAGITADGEWDRIWKRQVETHWEVRWAAYPWPDPPAGSSQQRRRAYGRWLDDAIAAYQGLLDPPSDWAFPARVATYRRRAPGVDGERPGANIGTAYGLLHALAQHGHASRKTLREFAGQIDGRPLEELGEKDTLDGRRQALHPGGKRGQRRDVIETWKTIAGALIAKNRYAEVSREGHERLSAVSAVKRFAFREHLEGELGIPKPVGGATPYLRFPSTSSIATAPFKAAILDHLTRPTPGSRLVSSLRRHLDSLRRSGIPDTAGEGVVPGLEVRLKRLRESGSPHATIAAEFLRFDGELLFPETYAEPRLKDDYAADELSTADRRALTAALHPFLAAAAETDLGSPGTYFTVLALDVDEVGRWLSGEHEETPKLTKVMVPRVAAELRSSWSWGDVLDERRPLGPALHATISQALADFANRLVPQAVEAQGLGRIVYAGGDDLLALLPASCAIAAARLLRALVSGQVRWQERDRQGGFLDVDLGQTNGYVTAPANQGGRLDPAVGPRVTASVGVAIAHHHAPLDGVLAAAREGLGAAKALYGRNALCVAAMKRSGETLRVGSRWAYPAPKETGNGAGETDGGAEPDPIGLFEEVRGLFAADEGLSPRFSQDVYREARILAGIGVAPESQSGRIDADQTAWAAPLRGRLSRLLDRHSGAEGRKLSLARLASHLGAWAVGLDGHRQQWERSRAKRLGAAVPDYLDEDRAPQRGPVELAEWLLLARFLSGDSTE